MSGLKSVTTFESLFVAIALDQCWKILLFGLQTLFDPMTLIILGALVLCLVLWGIFAARRKPTLVATVREEPVAATPIDATLRTPAPPLQTPMIHQPSAMPSPGMAQSPPLMQGPVYMQQSSMPVVSAAAPVAAPAGFGPGPFPLPPAEIPLQDSRVVAPTEVVLVWRAVSSDVEEYTVRIDTVSRDQLVFGGLARSALATPTDTRYERRLFHTMVLPNESMLSLRTRAGAPINNVRAWLRELPDAV